VKCLSLRGCVGITAQGVRSVLQNCTQLQEIDLGSNKWLVDSQLNIILSSPITNLRRLLLCANREIDSSVATICMKCPNLQVLDLSWCKDILVRSLRYLELLTELEELDLSWCNNLGNSALNYISRLPKLEKLNFEMCGFQVTDESDAVSDATVFNWPHLKEISFKNSPRVSESLLHRIAEHCTELRMVNVSGCLEVNDDAIAFLTSNCKKLTSLNLVGIATLTDDVVPHLIANCSPSCSIHLASTNVTLEARKLVESRQTVTEKLQL